MPLRMYAYAVLAEEKYKKHIYTVLINILQPSTTTEIVKRGEQRGEQRGILSGIELGLELKFCSLGKEIFSEINAIENIQVL
ncbi:MULTISPECIES: hypothetical protein [unclassified Okeania]|uniref:hypothetical protein n=1 Tax=unclassified Okeania TaxID=2634635 RepID=UPI00257ADB1A|nr:MULTISPECIES: hypothetical protein [unclassified Okeania]